MVTVCLIRIHFLTLFVDYINYMMQWPLQCKIREEPIHQKGTSQSIPLKQLSCTVTSNISMTLFL